MWWRRPSCFISPSPSASPRAASCRPGSPRSQRQAAYADAAKNGYLVGVTHISFPGLGNLRASADGKSFSWVPLNYSGLK